MNKRLAVLEHTGKYVFHGSTQNNLKTLEPRQGMHLSKPDGDPAVSATPYAEFASFRAIINRENIPFHFRSRFSLKNGMEGI